MSEKQKKIAYIILTVITCLGIAMSGVMNSIRADEIAKNIVALGFPTYLMSIIGPAKLIAAAIIAAPKLPRLKEWAYAGVTINMLGATASHIFTDGVTGEAIPPLLVLAVAMGSWALRPDSRKLSS